MENKLILPCCAAVLTGLLSGQLCVLILNSVPPKWLCDYGEKPGACISGKRVSIKKHGVLSGCALAASFTLLYLNYWDKPLTLFTYCLVSLALVISSVSDIKYSIIPDQFSAFIAVIGIAYYIYGCVSEHGFDKAGAFIGAICGGGLWILLGLIGKIIYREDTIGFGDVKLFAAAGFLLGFPAVLTAFFLTIVTAGAVFSVMLLLKKIDGKSYMPMAPYICAGCITSLAFKEYVSVLAAWYIHL